MITIHNDKYCKKLLFYLITKHIRHNFIKQNKKLFILFGEVKLFDDKSKKITKNLSVGAHSQLNQESYINLLLNQNMEL